MERYLIKTNGEEKKTHILRVGKGVERVGLIYTDFLVREGMRDITNEEIVNPANEVVGDIRLFRKDDMIAVRSDGKEIAAFDRDGTYREDGSKTKIKRYGLESLSSDKYSQLRAMGLTHAYRLADGSDLSHLFCFERDGNLASMIVGSGEEDKNTTALKGLVLALAHRIESQDYVFDFMGK